MWLGLSTKQVQPIQEQSNLRSDGTIENKNLVLMYLQGTCLRHNKKELDNLDTSSEFKVKDTGLGLWNLLP